MIGSVGKLDQTKLRTGRLGPEDWERLSMCARTAGRDAPISDRRDPRRSTRSRCAHARAGCKKQYGPARPSSSSIYLQLMEGAIVGARTGAHGNLRDFARRMKSLAKVTQGASGWRFSQLNRSLEQRPKQGGRWMSDLRECVTGDTLVAVQRTALAFPVSRRLVGTKPRTLLAVG